MKTLFIFFVSFFSILCTITPAQNEDFLKGKFYCDLLNFKSSEPGKTRVDVFVQVPYTEIQFLKLDDGFSGSYRLTVSVFDEDAEKLILEKIWTEDLRAKEYDETNAKKNFNLSLRSFDIVPGKYVFRVEIEDKNSKKSHSKEIPFTVRDLSEPFSVSDVMMIAEKSSVEGTNKILPNVSNIVLKQKEGIPLFYEIYADSSVPVMIEYNILDDEKEIVYKKSESKNLSKGKNQIFYTIMDSTLGLGNYIMSVAIKDNDDNDLALANKAFISRWVGFPAVVKNLEEAVEQLVYIGSADDIDYIQEAETKKEKRKRYLEFWKKKDPSPSTDENQVFDEYYRRIAYSNANFSHYIEGWKTDRGMVFILLGPPNNIDRHPFDFDSKPYEIWQYYQLNKNFIFVDQTGFGDYRLVTPLYGDFYRYRN